METLNLDQMPSQPSKLTELSKNAADQAGEGQFMNPGQKVKKPRGRPKGSGSAKQENKKIGEAQDAQKSEEPQIPTSEVIKPLINLISVGGAAYAGDDRARMKPEELEAGAMALGLVMDKYLPDMLNKYGPEIMCCMVFGQYGLRVMAIKKINDIENAKKQAKAQGDVVQMPEAVIKSEI